MYAIRSYYVLFVDGLHRQMLTAALHIGGGELIEAHRIGACPCVTVLPALTE